MPLQFPPGRVELLAFAIMVTTLIANLAFFVLISIAGSVFAGQISYFNAIAGIGWGVVVLGEKMPWSMLLSVAFIMMGLLLVRPKPSNEDVPAVRGAQPWPAE